MIQSISEVIQPASVICKQLVAGSEKPSIALPGWSKFSKKIGGVRGSELTVITADTSMGKTTWCVNLMAQLVKGGNPVLLISSEMSNRQLIGKFMGIFGVTMEDVAPLPIYFQCQDSDVFECLDAADKLGIKHILIDHLHHFVPSGDSQVYEIEQYISKLVDTTRKYDSHLFLIAHPAKLKNEKGWVTLNDIKGSSAIKQDADNIITLWRDRNMEVEANAGRLDLMVDIQKVRDDSGLTGVLTFKFDYLTQTYTE